MNTFREAVTQGRLASGPAMPVKGPKRRPSGDGLVGLQVPRTEARTHNQRTEDRQLLTGDEARLFVGRRSYVVDLLNLSGGGAMIRTDLALKLWKQVHLELGDVGKVECVVRWIKGARIGLEFAHETQVIGDAAKRDAMLLETIELNFPDVLAEPTSQRKYESGDEQAEVPDSRAEAQRRAELRHPLVWSGEIHYDYESTPVRIRNVSERGAMVDCTKEIPEGAELLLDLGGGGQYFAYVSWSRGDQLGLRFQQPFDIAWLAKTRPEVAPDSWCKPDYLNPGQDGDSPWADRWERLSLPELRDTLEGFLKR